ncbi:MAG: HAD family phosphatase [Verrucomicrobiales bacterium]|nr:HAD family phosphatase [Verrucomicrobiales bacterium]
MQTPSVIVFDLGKVLVDFDYSIAGRRVAALSNLPETAVQQFLERSPTLVRFETGQMSAREFYEEVRRATGFRGSFEQFAEFFADIFWEIPEMVGLHRALRERGFPTWIFSNTNPLAVGHIRRRFPFFSQFDGYILSYEVHAMKPDARIYEAFEARAGWRGAQVLYLDDRPENVAAGAARGWQVILQESPQNTLAAMRQLGLPV